MKRLFKRYSRLSARERRLFFRALTLVSLVRLGLWVVPYRRLQSWVDRQSRPLSNGEGLERHKIREVVWAVEAASRRIPRATCLTQGLVTQILLGQMGLRAVLRLGVARKAGGEFEAHAWVETDGQIVIGGAIEEIGRFVPLRTLSS